jgi:alpha-L-fucosidase
MDKLREKLRPSEKHLSFLNWEMGLFLHFGIRTFYEGYKDWDGKEMNPDAFHPTELNCEQWMETAAQAGFQYAVFTAKHHDGFATWPTQYSPFSVTASPWKDGKGDVVQEFVQACRKFGIKPGLYYSPAEYSLIKSEWTASDYDDYFLNQLRELLTGYGPIEVIWFDGSGSEEHEYDWSRIIGEIRRMQPGIRIFNMGDPDIRWIGNEAGIAPLDNWNEVDSVPFSILTEMKDGLGAEGTLWLPGECDFRMRLENWFYSEHDEDTVKSVDELMGLYYYSVGRGANLLINIGPDRRGLLPGKDAANLLEFGEEIRKRFTNALAAFNDFQEIDGNYVYRTEKPFLIDHAVLTENMVEGQSIRSFTIFVKPFPYGEAICVYKGGTVGHKAIGRFPTVRTCEVIVEIDHSEGSYRLEEIQLFHVAKF